MSFLIGAIIGLFKGLDNYVKHLKNDISPINDKHEPEKIHYSCKRTPKMNERQSGQINSGLISSKDKVENKVYNTTEEAQKLTVVQIRPYDDCIIEKCPVCNIEYICDLSDYSRDKFTYFHCQRCNQLLKGFHR